MLTPSATDPNPTGLQKKVIRRLKAAKIQHQLFETLAKTFDAVLAEDRLVLSRAERKRLLAQVTQSLLEEMLKKLAAHANAQN